MKKCCVLLMVAVLLTGCGSPRVYETVTDVYESNHSVAAGKVALTLPEEAAQIVSSQESGALYVCDGYSVTVQTLPGGDLEETVRTVTGFEKDALQIYEQARGDIRRYDCAWSCAGEGGDVVCRGVILDDGNYHYVMTVLAEAEQAGSLSRQINDLCASFDVR